MVGVITLSSFMYYNYGGVLQNYALVYYLNKNDIKAKSIVCDAFSFNDALRLFLYNRLGIGIWKKNRKVKITLGGREIQKNIRFKRFIDNYLQKQIYPYYSNSVYQKIDTQFDKIIVGSDQVWNPSFIRNKKGLYKYFLEFVPTSKRISYAASFGVSEIPEDLREIIGEKLKVFKAISVREDSGQQIVNTLAGKHAEVLIDPTMLLTRNEWKQVSKRASSRKEKPYILKYFLGEQSEERKNYIQKIADENGLEIYEMMDQANTELFAAGPDEFLDLVEHATLVCTDSFHATVFSILFGIPFLVMERTQNNMGNMGSRINTLLTKLQLDRRLPGNVLDENIFECDYTEAYQILEDERKKAYQFLIQALE